MYPADQQPFEPLVNSSSPSFNSSALGTTTVNYALESTALNRVWQGPSSRSIRLNTLGSSSFYFQLGSSTVAAGSTDSVLVTGSVIIGVQPKQTYIAVMSSTSTVVNVTLGVGR